MISRRGITFYKFADAPEHLRALSTCGGGEEYLAVVPVGVSVPDWWQPTLTISGVAGGWCSVLVWGSPWVDKRPIIGAEVSRDA
jgi:hypothetical protein